MPTLFTLLLLLGDSNGRASTKGIIAVIAIACYIGWYLFRAGRYLFRKAGWLTGEITGANHRIHFAPEAELESISPEEQMLQEVFPEGEEEVEEDVNHLRSRLIGYYPPMEIRKVYVSAAAFHALSKDKSEERLIAHIYEQSNRLFSEYDVQVLHDFVTARDFRVVEETGGGGSGVSD
jgi:hypothetical protein